MTTGRINQVAFVHTGSAVQGATAFPLLLLRTDLPCRFSDFPYPYRIARQCPSVKRILLYFLPLAFAWSFPTAICQTIAKLSQVTCNTDRNSQRSLLHIAYPFDDRIDEPSTPKRQSDIQIQSTAAGVSPSTTDSYPVTHRCTFPRGLGRTEQLTSCKLHATTPTTYSNSAAKAGR